MQDAYDDDDGEGWDGEEDATEDEGSSGLYRPNGSMAASSNGKGPMGFLGDSPPKSPAKVREGEAEGGGRLWRAEGACRMCPWVMSWCMCDVWWVRVHVLCENPHVLCVHL